jgi:hypothetical protein
MLLSFLLLISDCLPVALSFTDRLSEIRGLK